LIARTPPRRRAHRPHGEIRERLGNYVSVRPPNLGKYLSADTRGFARHMAGIDPQTQVPPLGLIPYRKRWRPPYIYTHREIRALMSGTVQVIASAQRAVTYATLIGLLAATGMRVGEALRLQAHDTDLVDGVITIRASKFGNYAEPAVMPSRAPHAGPGIGTGTRSSA